MAEDRRRSAEIRRMASQKVAAELTKGLGYDTVAAARAEFIDTVDWLDQDVVDAGDRAEAGVRRVRNEAPESPPEAQEVPAGTLPSPNGSEAVSDGASDPLSHVQQQRMGALLLEVDPELLKLQLWQLNLPFATDGSLSKAQAIGKAVALMTKGQAKQMVEWMKGLKVGS